MNEIIKLLGKDYETIELEYTKIEEYLHDINFMKGYKLIINDLNKVSINNSNQNKINNEKLAYINKYILHASYWLK